MCDNVLSYATSAFISIIIEYIYCSSTCPQAIEYSGAIHEALLQNSTSEVSQEEEGVRVVKTKQGTRALVTRTLNPEVDDNSAIMAVKEVCKHAVYHRYHVYS